jgi:hypothetical protein
MHIFGTSGIPAFAQTGVTLRDSTTQVAYEDIGGLKEEIQKVREMSELPSNTILYYRWRSVINKSESIYWTRP